MGTSKRIGKNLEFLGMDLDYSTPDEMQISMITCVNDKQKRFPEEIIRTIATQEKDY